MGAGFGWLPFLCLLRRRIGHTADYFIASASDFFIAKFFRFFRLHNGIVTMTESPPQTMQEQADEFHMMMGYCIAEWASVDDELFNIFQLCVGRKEPSAII